MSKLNFFNSHTVSKNDPDALAKLSPGPAMIAQMVAISFVSLFCIFSGGLLALLGMIGAYFVFALNKGTHRVSFRKDGHIELAPCFQFSEKLVQPELFSLSDLTFTKTKRQNVPRTNLMKCIAFIWPVNGITVQASRSDGTTYTIGVFESKDVDAVFEGIVPVKSLDEADVVEASQ